MWPDALVEKAKQISIPIEFDRQRDDKRIPRKAGLGLFDALASKEKTLHARAGPHFNFPRFEADSAVRFFDRHLGQAVTSPASRRVVAASDLPSAPLPWSGLRPRIQNVAPSPHLTHFFRGSGAAVQPGKRE